jgi:hypothetical protein
MPSLARRIAKQKARTSGPGKGPADTKSASVILKLNPATGQMQEYHFTKGWK